MKTAVILAGRKERDCHLPYPLMPFHGSLCLIERTLSILKELGYEHIYIVGGYKFESFAPFADECVKLIYNEAYAYTSSMSSLACVRNEIKEDFLLLEGDTFCERKVIEQLTHASYADCMAVTEESGRGNEAYVETKNGFVVKVSKDRHQITHFDGVLMGFMRISLPTFQKMLLHWDASNNLFLNYEYVFMDTTSVVDRPCISFKNLIWGDVNCKEDFHKLENYIYPKLRRKENPFDPENLLAHLQTIFPEREVKGAVITQIGGMSNKNFKVELDEDQYVLRVPGIGSEGMVNRSNEEDNSLKASNIGVNPAVRYFNSETGIKLVDFIPGAETLNGGTIQRQGNLRQIAQILRTLHRSKVRFNNDFNVFREIQKYEELLQKGNGKMYDGYEEIRPQIARLEEALNQYGVSLKPCHNDMVAENFVKSNAGKIYLIDWEYSGMNDPLWEFAALFIENNFTDESQEFFLHEYYGSDIPEYTHRKIFIYQILMDILWAIWTCIKEAAGDDFGSYGYDRYSRAVTNLKVLYEGNN